MFDRFMPANRTLVAAVRDGTYGRLEQLTLWNLTAHLWPGASLGLKVLPLEAMHGDLDIITRTLGRPRRVAVTTVARDDESASIEATLSFDGAFARDSVSSLMPMAWGARGGYTATFEHGVLDATSTMGFDGKPTGTVTAYTADAARELELPPADQYTAMIDHVLAVLRGEADNQITPASTLDALQLTLDIDQRVNGPR
jgi:predicted dehydrogenase